MMNEELNDNVLDEQIGCLGDELEAREVQSEDWELEARRMQWALEDAERNRETPLGEQIDGGNDHVADEIAGEVYAAQFDNDPNPYEGTFSEE
jgi:hypothetical protein